MGSRSTLLAALLLAALLLATLLGAGLVGPAAASPRPVAACEPCDRGFVSAARTQGVAVDVEHSTATMRVHRNGTATWTVENRLDDADAFENASLRETVAAAAVAVHDGHLLSTSVDGDVVRMRYRTPDVATDAPGGVLRVDHFRDAPGRIRSGLGADRLTLVAPAGMVVESGLPGGDVSGRRTTATTFESRGDGPFVTLVPEGSVLGPLRSLVAVAAPVLPVVGRNLLLLVAVPSLLFAGGVAALAGGAGAVGLTPTGTGSPDRRALAVVALGGLALGHPLYADFAFLGGSTPPLLAGGVGLIALGATLAVPAVRARCSLARLAGVVAGAFLVAVAAGLLLRALPVGDLAIREDASVVRLVLPMLPVYAVTLAGYAASRGRTRQGLAVVAVAFALVPVATFSITSAGGSLYFLGVALGVVGAVVGTVVGAPLFALGYGLPGEDRVTAGATTTGDDPPG